MVTSGERLPDGPTLYHGHESIAEGVSPSLFTSKRAPLKALHLFRDGSLTSGSKCVFVYVYMDLVCCVPTHRPNILTSLSSRHPIQMLVVVTKPSQDRGDQCGCHNDLTVCTITPTVQTAAPCTLHLEANVSPLAYGPMGMYSDSMSMRSYCAHRQRLPHSYEYGVV